MPKPEPRLQVSAYLAKRDGGAWRVVLREPGLIRELGIAEARALVDELAPLVALAERPELFDGDAR